MEFENSFTVNAPIQRVWDFLLNVPEIAPCMPGAELTEVVSDTEYKGTVKVKLGAVQMSYRGTAVIKEVDEQARKIVLSASGREARGTGSASSVTTSQLVEEGPNRTTVNLRSDVNVTGRVAQFGRGIMQDVASRLIGEFAHCLEQKLVDQEEARVGSEGDGAAVGDSAAADGTATQPAQAGVPASATQTAPSPTAIAGQSPPTEPEPIRIWPLLRDVARSQIARGLRKLASMIEPEQR